MLYNSIIPEYSSKENKEKKAITDKDPEYNKVMERLFKSSVISN